VLTISTEEQEYTAETSLEDIEERLFEIRDHLVLLEVLIGGVIVVLIFIFYWLYRIYPL